VTAEKLFKARKEAIHKLMKLIISDEASFENFLGKPTICEPKIINIDTRRKGDTIKLNAEVKLLCR
jgi:hypothetical protein